MAGKAAKFSTGGKAKRRSSEAVRKLVVFGSLAGSLTLTALFLQVLSPPPVRPIAHNTVLMSDPIERISSRLDTQHARPWKSIFIHHSYTQYADPQSLTSGELGDHFVIGNGMGAGDGDMLVSQHWQSQRPPLPPRGARSIDPDCISVCLVGNFDESAPTAAQMQRLTELVTRLSSVYGVPPSRVFAADQPGPMGNRPTFPGE